MRASHSYARSASANRFPTSSAIAASTKFQGSVWPPGTHGMFPSGCCTHAIPSIVCAISSGVMMPGTSGSSLRMRRDLFSVQHDALAEHRVERALESCRPLRVALDAHAEELVVALHRDRVGVVETERALQPPVRRVERVRVMRSALVEARALDLQLEFVLAVDAHVPTGRVVIAPVGCP